MRILIFFSIVFCSIESACVDGPYCRELILNRFATVSLSSKCSLWVYLIASDLFPLEADRTILSRTSISSYCPLSCGKCQAATTTKPTTAKATTTTTASPEKRAEKILAGNSEFSAILKGLEGDWNASEVLERFAMYNESKAKTEKHNKLFESGASRYQQCVNKFSIMKSDEIAVNGLMSAIEPTPFSVPEIFPRRKRDVSNVDWRQFMRPIEDQKNCGGCWAFAIVGAIEGFAISQGRQLNHSLSIQQLLDCDRAKSPIYSLANLGCDGGFFQVASEYLAYTGVVSSSIYPFRGSSSNRCRLNSSINVATLIKEFDTGFVTPKDSAAIQALNQAMEDRVRLGPVATGMAVNAEIYAYGNGIYDGNCGNSINHAVVIVGFTEDYWIVRNSWGSDWGEAGYIRIKRNSTTDPCHLVRYWTRPSALRPFVIIGNDMAEEENDSSTSISLPSNTTTACCDGECCEDCCEEECDCDDEDDFFEENEDFLTMSTSTLESETTSTNMIATSKIVTIASSKTSNTKTPAKPTTKKNPRPNWWNEHDLTGLE